MKQILHLSFKKSLMLVVLAVFTSLSFQAKALTDVSGDWEYYIPESPNDMVIITAYNGTASSLSLPSQIITGYSGPIPIVKTVYIVDMDTPNSHVQTLTISKSITRIENLDFPEVTTVNFAGSGTNIGRLNVTNLDELLSINSIPASVSYIDPLPGKVQSITFAPGNTDYEVVNNVLYEIRSTERYLHTYPRSGGPSTFTIPSDVTRLLEGAFDGNSSLQTIYINHNGLSTRSNSYTYWDQYCNADWIFNGTDIDVKTNYIVRNIRTTGHFYAPAGTETVSGIYGGPSVKSTAPTSERTRLDEEISLILTNIFKTDYSSSYFSNGHVSLTYTAKMQVGLSWIDVGTINENTWTFTPNSGSQPTTIKFTCSDGHFDASHTINIEYAQDLTGTASISGTFKYDETLTASSTTNNSGSLSYTWLRNGSPIPISPTDPSFVYTGTTYTLQEDDVDEEISVRVESSFETGSITSAAHTVERADYDGPMTASISLVTANQDNIVISCTESGVEYGAAISLSQVVYQDNLQMYTYNGDIPMEPNTTYAIFYRYKATETHNASPAVGALQVTTAQAGSTLQGTVTIGQDCDNPATIIGTVTLDANTTSQISDLNYVWKTSDGNVVPSSKLWGDAYSISITPSESVGNCYLEVSSSIEDGTLLSNTMNVTDVEFGVPAPSAPTIDTEGPELGDVYLVPDGTIYEYIRMDDATPPCSYDAWSGYSYSLGEDLTPGSTVFFYKRTKRQIYQTSWIAPTQASEALIYNVPKATLTLTLHSGSNPNPLANTSVTINSTNYTSNANGEIIISELMGGNFDYTIVAAGYENYSDSKNIININESASVILTQSSASALTGTVTISGTLQYGEELTVAVSETNNTGTLSYQWKRDGLAISGASSSSYTLSESDITKSISVDVTSSVQTGSISSTGTTAIEKADKAAPVAPSLASKTHNSITLTAVEGCEYYESLELGTRQSSPEFTNLVANTGYDFQQRYVETATHKTSPWSGITSIATDEEPINALTGTVTISGTLQYGEELTASVSETNNTGTLSYQWKRDGSSISGASSSSYTLSESDISKSISVDVTSSVETGTISSVGTAAIEKADKAAPAAPSLASKTHNSITLTAVEGCEYYESLELGTRQSSPEFTNLVANTGYDFQQRYVETATHKTSPWSGITSIATDEEPVNALTGTVTISGTLQYGEELTVAVSETNNTGTLTYQWKRDGSNIGGATSTTYTLAEADITKSISVDVTSSVESGNISSTGTAAIEKADKAAPAAPSLANKTHNSITLTAEEGCEYYESMELDIIQSSPEFTNLVANTGYDFQQRYVETATHKTSPWSEITSIATDEEPVNALTGTVTISGTLQFGQELSVAVTETNNTGTLSYQWKRDEENIIGATSNAYTLVEADISKSISVEVTSSVETGSISSAGTTAIEKANQEAPNAPILASKTHNSITLNAIEGAEYAMDGGAWQASVEFTGLSAATSYSLTQRYVETTTHKASAASSVLNVETETAPANVLSGTVTITGTLQYGEELMASVTETNNTGTMVYQWKRDEENIIGATSNAYTLVEADISKSISVEVTSSVETGSISSTGTAAIEKADQVALDAPTVASKTHNSITLNAIEGAEYAIDGGAWQSSVEFVSLEAETTYALAQRSAETNTHNASPASASLNVTTDEMPVNALSGTVTISGTLQFGEVLIAEVTETNNTGTLSYQWKRDGEIISGASSETYELVESDITHPISVEVTSSVQTGSISSAGTTAIEKADQVAPDAPTVASKTHNSITLNAIEGAEYAIDGGAWQSSVEFVSLEAETTYALAQRSAETNTHNASPASASLNVTTDEMPVNALSGTVTISGTLQFGEVLIAEVTETNNTGTLSYQWKRDGEIISGASSETYELVESDITHPISVEVTSSVQTGSISSAGTTAIEKADQVAPDAPTVASKTHNSITLNAIEGAEYAIDGGAWQASVEFTGLSAATSYSLTQRYVETTTHKASAASSVLNVETETAPANVLSGTVTITGTLQYGEELMASVTETNNTGTLAYQWKHDEENIIGATSNAYSLVEADISKSISVEVTSSVETGSISSTGTAAIEKADQVAPDAPTVASKTHNSITLNAIEGAEYAIDGGAWQSSVEFTGLIAETEYSLTQRYTETSTHNASAASAVLNVETEVEPGNTLIGTVTITGTLQYGEELMVNVTETNNTGTLSYQWKRDGEIISGASSETYELVEADITHSISVEVTSSVQTGSIASAATTVVEKAYQDAPDAPGLLAKTHDSITLVLVEGCEYATDEGAWQQSNVFDGLIEETTYSFTQRYVETNTHNASEASVAVEITTDELISVMAFANKNIKIYPNPTRDIVNISGCVNQNYILFDTFGKIVSKGIINVDVFELNLIDIKAGIYFLITEHSNHRIIKL